MIRWFRRWVQRRQRRADVEILWPVILEKARDAEHARKAFRAYCDEDPAWCALSREEYDRQIAALEERK